MRIIYSDGFSENERLRVRPLIISNLLTDLKILLDIIKTEGIVFGTENTKVNIRNVQAISTSSYVNLSR